MDELKHTANTTRDRCEDSRQQIARAATIVKMGTSSAPWLAFVGDRSFLTLLAPVWNWTLTMLLTV